MFFQELERIRLVFLPDGPLSHVFGFTHLDLSGRIPYDAVRGVAGVALKVGTAKKKKPLDGS